MPVHYPRSLLALRVTDGDSLYENVQWDPCSIFVCFIVFKRTYFCIVFAITAAGVVPCGGPKTSPRTSSIVQIIFYFCPLRSVGIF